MLVGQAVRNYELRSAFHKSTDTSQLMESMTGECICISLRLSKHKDLSIPSHC